MLVINKIKYEIILLSLILAGSIIRICTSDEKPFPYGDAAEYILMTEALYNHCSPEIQESDYESFKKLFLKSNLWSNNEKSVFFDEIGSFIQKKSKKRLEFYSGFFSTESSKVYSCHFFTYSIFAIPIRFICNYTPFNPFLIHQITNILILIITCILFIKYSVLDRKKTFTFIIIFFFSSILWYLPWQHSEVFTTCLTAVGVWIFFSNRLYLGLLLTAIAATQNQPISVLTSILAIITFYKNGFSFKNYILTCIIGSLIFLPSIFYLIHFNTFNIIKEVGSLRTELVTLNRVVGFFIDLNQGAILSIPLVLIIYIILVIKKLLQFKNQEIKWDILIPLALIGMACSAATIDNWNHGQTAVNRYTTYVSGVIIVHFFFLINKTDYKLFNKIILLFAVLTQIATTLYHLSISKKDWSGQESKPLANWVLENFPALYNPDPAIFINRYSLLVVSDYKYSPAYYMKKDGELIKLLVREEYINNLILLGFDKGKVDSIRETLSFENGWAYININENFKSAFNKKELKKIDDERKIKQQINIIKSIPDWYIKIKEKSKIYDLSEDRILRQDAAFLLGIKIKIPGTYSEKIDQKIKEIKKTEKWFDIIKIKAIKQSISIDSMLYIEAKWIVDQAEN